MQDKCLPLQSPHQAEAALRQQNHYKTNKYLVNKPGRFMISTLVLRQTHLTSLPRNKLFSFSRYLCDAVDLFVANSILKGTLQ